MSHSQFHCTGRVYLDLHGLIFETSICYWQDQPGSPGSTGRRGDARPTGASGWVCFAERTPCCRRRANEGTGWLLGRRQGTEAGSVASGYRRDGYGGGGPGEGLRGRV